MNTFTTTPKRLVLAVALGVAALGMTPQTLSPLAAPASAS